MSRETYRRTNGLWMQILASEQQLADYEMDRSGSELGRIFEVANEFTMRLMRLLCRHRWVLLRLVLLWRLVVIPITMN